MAGIRRSKIRKGDTVEIIAGRDYNKFVKRGGKVERVPARGRVLEVLPAKGKVKVEGAGIIKKHQRADRNTNRGGGIIDREAYIDISNVQLVDPQTGKPTRVRYETNSEGKKTRVAVKSGNIFDK